jgi:uncharacterized protein (DUF362 family)/Pyruvate/2-oxoacid:ferredoxin oxidoreductase delta subunit
MNQDPKHAVEKSRVALVKCAVYDLSALKAAIASALDKIGGIGSFLVKGRKILLKPNLMMPKPAGFPAITHPQFIRAVAELFLETGAEVTIGESAAGSQAGVSFTKASLRTSGLEEIGRQIGAQVVNFDFGHATVLPVDNPYVPRIPVARAVLDADLVVSLPKLKTHTYANIITGAVKNMYGTIPSQVKADFHRLAPRPAEFYTVVRDLYGLVRPGLTIFDAVDAMAGDGPSAGVRVSAGFIIASRDGVAADAVAAELVGVPARKVLTTRLCAEAGLGRGTLDEIEVVGESLAASVLADFKLPATAVVTPALYRIILSLTRSEPHISRPLCTRCQTCVNSCPVKAMSLVEDRIVIDRSVCIRCFCCNEVCPEQAIHPKRRFFAGNWLSKLILSRW